MRSKLYSVNLGGGKLIFVKITLMIFIASFLMNCDPTAESKH